MIGPCYLGKTASIVHQDLAASAAIGLANLIVMALGQKVLLQKSPAGKFECLTPRDLPSRDVRA
jgi:hypothetical protein